MSVYNTDPAGLEEIVRKFGRLHMPKLAEGIDSYNDSTNCKFWTYTHVYIDLRSKATFTDLIILLRTIRYQVHPNMYIPNVYKITYVQVYVHIRKGALCTVNA